MEENTEFIAHHGADAAPEGDLELLQDFVNTNDLERGNDALGTPQLLDEWLAARALADGPSAVDPAGHARLLAIREGIRALGRANNDEPLDATLVDAMNRAARSVPLTVAVTPGAGDREWRLEPAASGVDAFAGRILAAMTRSMADGSWSRVKACRNDTCRWLFFDRSRNRSGTWCTMAVCGSRMKARAYRARRREPAGA